MISWLLGCFGSYLVNRSKQNIDFMITIGAGMLSGSIPVLIREMYFGCPICGYFDNENPILIFGCSSLALIFPIIMSKIVIPKDTSNKKLY